MRSFEPFRFGQQFFPTFFLEHFNVGRKAFMLICAERETGVAHFKHALKFVNNRHGNGDVYASFWIIHMHLERERVHSIVCLVGQTAHEFRSGNSGFFLSLAP